MQKLVGFASFCVIKLNGIVLSSENNSWLNILVISLQFYIHCTDV